MRPSIIRHFFRFILRSAPAAALLAGLGAQSPAHAASSPWAETDHGAVRLIAAGATAGSADRLSFGLQFRMKPGWKIYWRSPGDAGFPPQPDWSGSENVAKTEISWPVPHRFTVLGLETLGYKNGVVLPLAVMPKEPGQAVTLRTRVRYLTCADICVPYEAKLALALPAGPEAPSAEAGIIARYALDLPNPNGTGGLAVKSVTLSRAGGHPMLNVAVAAGISPFKNPDVFVEGPPGVTFGAPRATYSEDRSAALLRVAVGLPLKDPPALSDKELTLTLVDGGRAVEYATLPSTATAPGQGAGGGSAPMPAANLIVILALAFLGGLILNLMPCVLPVLSIKLLSVVGQGGRERAAVRTSFLYSAAGIVVSFLVLAGGAIALKEAGMAAGWGLQFQHPWFLGGMALIVTLFAANLFGFFEIRLPGAVGDAAANIGHGHGHSHWGHFLTGAFATLLATPCSAPFLGTAVGFALARGPAEIIAVFIMLGLGLSTPYLLVAAFPGLAASMPKPGRWMIWLRRVLGLVLAATAVWLVSVMVTQVGMRAALAIGGVLLAVLAVLWLAGRWHRRPALSVGAWGIAAALAVTVFLIPGWVPPGIPAGGSQSARAAHWIPFDSAAIAQEVALGRVVFVDVTADWCITCKVNKAVVLERDPVASRLAAPSITAMMADWTRPDSAIAAYLRSFGRYGIPFNAVYGPGAPDGIALPELLTETAVLDALDSAKGPAHMAGK